MFNPGLALGAFVAASCATCLPVFQNEFADRLELSAFGIAVALSSMLLTRFLISWPIGRIADRMDEYRLIYAGLALLAGSTLLLGLTASFPALLLARIIMGIGMALFSVPALRIVSGDPESRDHTFRISLLTAAFSCGVGVGPLLTGLCAARFGFMAPFIAWSLLSLATAGFILSTRENGALQRPPLSGRKLGPGRAARSHRRRAGDNRLTVWDFAVRCCIMNSSRNRSLQGSK